MLWCRIQSLFVRLKKIIFFLLGSWFLYNNLNVAPLPSIISLTYAWNICKYLTNPCLRSEHFSWENLKQEVCGTVRQSCES